MASGVPRHRLSSLDAFFLYHERSENPFNLGGVSIFDGEITAGQLIQLLERRIGQVPRYRQRLVSEVLNIGHPLWVDDPDFDVSRHVVEFTLDPPGNEDQLSQLSGQIMGQMLSRDRPLWDLSLVKGLPGGHTALIVRIHHCLVDGLAGVGLMKLLLGLENGATEAAATPLAAQVAPKQDRRELPRKVFDAVLGGVREIVDRALDANEVLLSLARTALLDNSYPGGGGFGRGVAKIVTPPERLPFNGPLSGERSFDWLKLPLAAARTVRSGLKGSINDVILTIVGSAVSRYLLERGEPVAGRRMRVMVPVSIRPDRNLLAAGNSISFLPLDLPLDLDEPMALFAAISHQTAALKNSRIADLVNLMISIYGTIPAPIQALAGSLVSNQFLPFNLISTNVPGPEVPLYSAGRRMVAHYPYVPIAYSIGLGIATLSYNQDLCLGLTSDRRVFPDAGRIRELLIESFDRLYGSVAHPVRLSTDSNGRGNGGADGF